MKKVINRGPGRPPVFVGKVRRSVVSQIRKLGLTHAQTALAERGIEISMPTLGKIAASENIKLKRGRPVAKVAKAA